VQIATAKPPAEIGTGPPFNTDVPLDREHVTTRSSALPVFSIPTKQVEFCAAPDSHATLVTVMMAEDDWVTVTVVVGARNSVVVPVGLPEAVIVTVAVVVVVVGAMLVDAVE